MINCILPSLEVCNQWICKYVYEMKCCHIGFDTESRSSSGVLAIIQLATPLSVMIYRVYEQPLSEWPKELINVLENKQIFKYCVDIRQDVKLLNDIGIKPNSLTDLQIEAQTYLNLPKRLGFKTLIKDILKLEFNKSKSIQSSNWSKLLLTQKQIEYACDDAIGCLALAETMKLYQSDISILNTVAWKARYFTKFIDPTKPETKLKQLENSLVSILKSFTKYRLVKDNENFVSIKQLNNIPELYFTIDDIHQIISINQSNKLELKLIGEDYHIRVKVNKN